jgi:hypothetical protein
MLAAKTIEKLNQLNSSKESILSGTKAEVLEFDRNNFSHLSTNMDAKACSFHVHQRNTIASYRIFCSFYIYHIHLQSKQI